MLIQKHLQDRLDYDPETGLFTWKYWPEANRSWNSKYPGKQAGALRRDGYITIHIAGKQILAHRLAWLYIYRVLPDQLDHKNRKRSDNRISNLRPATHTQNMTNRTTKNLLGRGVVYTKGNYYARIYIEGKRKYIGKFNSKEEAADAYRKAAEEHYGDFAYAE